MGTGNGKCNAKRIIYFSRMLRLEDLRAKLDRFPRMETTIELAISSDWKLSVEDHNDMISRMSRTRSHSTVKPEKMTERRWKLAEKRLAEAAKELPIPKVTEQDNRCLLYTSPSPRD